MSIPTYRPGKKFAFIMNLLYYGPKPINQPSEEKLIVFKMPELMSKVINLGSDTFGKPIFQTAL
jgi:hypothetical protein